MFLRLFGAALVLSLAACSGTASPPDWIRQNAAAIDTVDPAAPLDDLAPLRRSVGDAEIVGVGESVHGAAEEITLKHRVLRVLVEQMGFRSVAWEEDWTTGREIDEYIRTGSGDLGALMSRMSPQWQSRQVADVLRWLLCEHLAAIRPSSPDVFEHIQADMSVADKEPYIRHARQVEELIAALPHEPGDREYAAMLHTARQIVSFHEHFNLPDSENVEYREARAAENLRWWRDQSGDKIAYWAASPHTANAPQLRIASSTGDMRFASAGSYLRRWYGERYRSIGFTFGRGAVRLGGGQAATMPDPAQDWFERPMHDAGADQLVLDLRTPAPPAVRRWLDAPMRSRGLPDRGPDSFMDGGSPAQWFDVVVHRRDVTPVLAA